MADDYSSDIANQEADKSLATTRVPSYLFLLVLADVLSVSPAFGSAEAGQGGSFMDHWLWPIINFAILVVLLVKFTGKPLRDFLRKRTELIEKTLHEAREAKELAQKALTEVEERLKMKDREIEEILAGAKRSAQREQEELIQQGEQMREKILVQAKNNIDYEVRRAKESIQAEAVEIALELAEKKLKERMTDQRQTTLIEESLKTIESKK